MTFADIKNIREGLPVFQLSRKTAILSLSVAGAALALVLLPYSRDFSNYETIFENASGAQNLIDSFSASEPIFSGLSYLTTNLFLSVFILACLGLCIKLNYLTNRGEAAWIATTIYFARFFIVHEVTQIRASFAVGLLLAGYMLLIKSRNVAAVLCLLAAVGSHISSLIYIPVICYAALVRNPVLILRRAFIVLLGVLLFKIVFPINLAGSGLDTFVPEKSRLLEYLLHMDVPDVPGLLGEKLLYLKLLAIGVIAFTTQIATNEGKGVEQKDWPVRAGLILTFACMLFIVLYDNYIFAARFSDLSAPFECAVLAAFILFVADSCSCLLGKGGATILKITITAIIVVMLFIPQLLLLH